MATSHPKDSLLPHRNSTGGPLPVLRLALERANGGRRWRMSAGFLIHAALLATVLLLPVLITKPSNPEPPGRTIIVFAPPRGQPTGTPGATGGNGYGTPQPHRVPDLSGRPQLPVAIEAGIGPGPDVGLGPGPVGQGVPGGSEFGVPGGTGPGVNPPAPQQPIRVGGRLRAPRLLQRVEPEYPLLALRAGIEGDVLLDAVLGADGRVAQVTVLRGHPALAAAAAAAVRQWVYEPTYLNDKPVPVALEIVVQFRLRR